MFSKVSFKDNLKRYKATQNVSFDTNCKLGIIDLYIILCPSLWNFHSHYLWQRSDVLYEQRYLISILTLCITVHNFKV